MSNTLIELINRKKRKNILSAMPTVSEVTELLLEIMKEHIGRENSISFLELFKELFDNDYDETNLEHWFKAELIRKATHACRKYTKCQIISANVNKESRREYWVANSMTDALLYKDFLEKQIKAMRGAESRMFSSIKNRWYNKTNEWQLKQRL